MMAFLQAVGIVFLLVVGIILTVVLLYLSYILAIGIAVAGLIYIVYRLLTAQKYMSNL